MEEKEFDNIFENLEGRFDHLEPNSGHEKRFLERLASSNTKASPRKRIQLWKSISIAASIVFLCVLGYQVFFDKPTIKEQIVEIAPEVAKSDFYFTSLIEEQIQELNVNRTPNTDQLIDDLLAQLKKIELDYQKLEKELINGGNSKLLLNAMIQNFQTRINLLKEASLKIEEIKNYKNEDNEVTI